MPDGSTRFRGLAPLLFFLLLPLVISCSAVKIETGQTTEERQESEEERARQFKIRWSTQFEKSDEKYRVQLLLDHLDQVKAWYKRVGDNIASQWRDGNSGRGEEIPGSEMQMRIDNSLKSQAPTLRAWEEIIEYALGRIKQARYFDQQFLGKVGKLADDFYAFNSAVTFPKPTVDEYDFQMRDTGVTFDDLMTEVRNDLSVRN